MDFLVDSNHLLLCKNVTMNRFEPIALSIYTSKSIDYITKVKLLGQKLYAFAILINVVKLSKGHTNSHSFQQ